MDPTDQQTQLCQCCLTNQGAMKNMMTETYQSMKLSESLQICFGLNLLDGHQPTTNIIRGICSACETNLKLAFDFREQCFKSQKLLQERTILLETVKDEPLSDEEPLILCTSSTTSKKGRGRPMSDVKFTQVFVKTSSKAGVPIVKIEEMSSKTSTEKEVEESMAIAEPIQDEDNSNNESDDGHPDETTQRSHYSSDSDDDTNKLFETTDSRDPRAELPGRFMCYLCDEFFNTFAAYITHRDNHYSCMNRVENRQINRTCFVCKERVVGYVKHLSDCHPDFKPNECLQCDMKTRGQRHLRDHLATHLQKKLYKCRGCKLNFRTKSSLYSHLTSFQHKKGQYQCILCGLCYRLFADLDDHYHMDHKRKAHKHFFPCYACKRVFAFNKFALVHKCNPMTKKHNKANKQSEPPVHNHKCPQCDQRFDNADELLCHKITLCVGRFGCNVEGCGKMFTRQRDLSNHILQEHDAVKMCDQCGFSTKKINKMKWHKKKVHNPNYQKVWEDLPCVECGKVLHSKHAFDRHIEVYHLGPRKFFECHLCPAKFRTLQSIQSHMVEHLSPELLHSCSICEKKFVTAAMIEKHMKVHRNRANNVRWECDACPKSFNSSSNLNEHKHRIHESKYYECCYCHNSYSSRNVLRYHLYEHRGFRPFNCPACPSNFVRQYLFVQHLKKHGITFDKDIHGYVEKEDLSEILKSCERRGGGGNLRPLDIIRSNKV